MTSKRLLAFLIPAFIVALIYAYLQTPRQERVTPGNKDGAQRSTGKKSEQSPKISGGYPRLRSDLLERKSQPYPGVRRDLFFSAFPAGQDEEVTGIIPEAPTAVEPPEVPVAPPPPPPPPPSPQELARQELSRYKFLGFFKKGVKQTIFLSSSDEIFLVRKGDYLGRDRKYYVVNITDTTLELRKDGAGDFSIKLTDQESLSAVSRQGQSKLENGPSSLRPAQEMGTQAQPEFQTIPDEERQSDEQIQSEEDNNETQK